MTPRLLEELVSGRPNQRLTFQIGNPNCLKFISALLFCRFTTFEEHQNPS